MDPMSQPDYSHGYLRVPLAVWDQIYCRAPLTRRQLQILSWVVRQSWGWQTKSGQVYTWTRPLTPRQLAAATGLSTDHLARDLRTLVACGVLREQGQRYQLVPEVRLWKTSPARVPKARPPAPKPPAAAAETALRPLASKIAKKTYKNVHPPREDDLSRAVDNSPLEQRRTRAAGTSRRRSPEGTERVGTADRLASFIETFVGPLPEAKARALRGWIEAEGVVPVWDSLEPVFRQGRVPTRAHLLKLLTARAHPEGEHA